MSTPTAAPATTTIPAPTPALDALLGVAPRARIPFLKIDAPGFAPAPRTLAPTKPSAPFPSLVESPVAPRPSADAPRPQGFPTPTQASILPRVVAPRPTAPAPSAPAPSAQAPPPATLPRYLTRQCPFTKTNLLGLLRTNNRYPVYEYHQRRGTLVRHQCLCQVQTTENDLHPVYAVNVGQNQPQVIMTYNVITCKIEQYVYVNGVFEEVKCEGLVYDISQKKASNFIAMTNKGQEAVFIERHPQTGTIRKVSHRSGMAVVLPEAPVKTRLMKKLIKKNVNTLGGLEQPKGSFLPSSCPHLPMDIVHVASSSESGTSEFSTFAFNYKSGEFEHFHCDFCENVKEEDLIPKYVSKTLKTFVIHAHNLVAKNMEKFVLREDGGFQQVICPEIPYDASKDNVASTLFVSEDGEVVVSRDEDGKLRKEKLNQETGIYEVMPAVPVKTLMGMKKARISDGPDSTSPKRTPTLKRSPSPSMETDGTPREAKIARMVDQQMPGSVFQGNAGS